MTINMAAGAAAYANAAKQISGTTGAVSGIGQSTGTGGGFADMLQNAVQGAIDSSKAGEAASMGAVTGKADINSVVAAVNNAEVTLQTVLAVRDKVLAAYSEIMHMTI
jgi:flagellar hook-basal body complex protein FliE